MHRDLKPSNILLQANGDYDSIKIIDFGLASTFEVHRKNKDFWGTPEYMAPEVYHLQTD